MPESYREIIGSKTELVVWKITESEAELEEGLSFSPKAHERLSQRKSEIHRKGYLAIRQLLRLLGIPPEIHQYDSRGAPYLTDGRFISISHSQDCAAVVVSSTPVGLDLEHRRVKIKRISSRFLHPSELEHLGHLDQVAYLTQIWTAKEALYKVLRKPGIHFSSQLKIDPFKPGAPSGTGTVLDQEKTQQYTLYYRYFEGYCLSLAIQ
ncbi:4'-phosphopantetheinyl transferase superfamily protein [Flavobacteriaceae bacterium]|nr:4'-phosphopantetheinyl transferase superfamily protein [Flavobacteriaceae bacterium]